MPPCQARAQYPLTHVNGIVNYIRVIASRPNERKRRGVCTGAGSHLAVRPVRPLVRDLVSIAQESDRRAQSVWVLVAGHPVPVFRIDLAGSKVVLPAAGFRSRNEVADESSLALQKG